MINLAKTAGFCFGVKRAMDIAFSEAEVGTPLYTLGPLIHNGQAVERLESMGVKAVSDIDAIPDGARVVIRTHGVGADVYTALQNKGIEIIDATCPFVKKIHKIVSQYHNKGYTIIIAGDSSHPEVKGINGWCENSAVIAENTDQLKEKIPDGPVCLVSQTTITSKTWEKIKNFIKKSCQNHIIFDTICSATKERQEEAQSLAQKSDAMVVIGGRQSSNTVKLYELCKAHCKDTCHIENVSELPTAVLDKAIIGVTAGASTPEWVIKEAINKMSEEKTTTEATELSFAEAFEQSLVSLKSGDIVKGTVIGITPTEVYVNLGFKADGVIPVSELSDDPDVKPESIVKVGEEVEVFVVRVSDVEGTVMLSKKKLDSIAGWKKIEGALESREILEGKVIEAVNGGVIVLSNGVRVFVPASQASERYTQDLSTLVGNDVRFRIIDVNSRRRKIVGSVKSVSMEERKAKQEAFWADAEVGKEYNGTVKSLTDFGAFVDIGGVDGLVHISELSWGRIKHPSEVMKVGDQVSVYVIELDKDKNKVSLGYRRQADNPWNIAKEKLNVGDVIKVKIVRLVPFGAFAEIMPHIDGLIHISQIANERIAKPADVLSVGQEVDVKITDIDWEAQKISLSIRALIEPEEKPAQEEAAAPADTEDKIVASTDEEIAATLPPLEDEE